MSESTSKAKEKADELFEKLYLNTNMDIEEVKQCALICVEDEIKTLEALYKDCIDIGIAVNDNDV